LQVKNTLESVVLGEADTDGNTIGIVSNSPPVSKSEQQEFVDAINKFRCMHGAGNVEWDDDVAESAQSYVGPLTEMKHSDCYNVPPPAGPAGENIYWSSATSFTPEKVSEEWYSEVNNCNPSPEAFSDGCQSGSGTTGHFTAMIWKGVTKIGCGWSNDGHIALCRFKGGDRMDCTVPNMGGCYVDQVGTLKKTESQCGGSSSSPSPAAGTPTPAPTPAPTPSHSGSCITSQGCDFTSHNCGGSMVHFSFKCNSYTMTAYMPSNNYTFQMGQYCNSCGAATVKMTSIKPGSPSLVQVA